MNILTVSGITKSYSRRLLFDDASFFLQEGEKAGVLGVNGTGKSTLLKMIAGIDEPDKGEIIMANHVVVRYLPQHPVFEEEETVLQSVVRGNKTKENEWTIEADAKAMLTRLGITNFDEKCVNLSGGQRKRLALVSVLLSPADILILDEPTNHLDNEMADWLEDVLKKWRGALIMVTHDRYFLDSVSNRIIEIDKGKIYSYDTNYSGYLERKAQREESLQASERKRQSILRTELAWVQRGARARSTKQRARLERYEEMKNRLAPVVDNKVQMASIATRLGKTTLELDNISKGYGEKQLIKDFTYIFLKGEHVGFVGGNGCGKTTLMKLLTGQIQPDAGTITVGQTVKIGYYAQEMSDKTQDKESIYYMNPQKRVIDYMRDIAEYVETTEGKISASKMLERFLFEGSEQYSLIENLSGGEKRRLNLLRVLMEAPNILILDEPTNDLDITTLTILEDFIDQFMGIVIVVSHDRYFLDRTVGRIFAFEGNGEIVQYEGGYSDYTMKKAEKLGLYEEKAVSGNAKSSSNLQKSEIDTNTNEKKGKPREKKLKFSFKEQKEFETIEDDIAALEEKIQQLEMDMVKYATDFVKLNEISKEKELAETNLGEKMDRWMYLEELDQRIKAGEMVLSDSCD